MSNKDGHDNRESTDGGAREEPESRPGWKSKWVESTAPAADVPDDVKYDGPRLSPPEQEEVPGDGGEETTAS